MNQNTNKYKEGDYIIENGVLRIYHENDNREDVKHNNIIENKEYKIDENVANFLPYNIKRRRAEEYYKNKKVEIVNLEYIDNRNYKVYSKVDGNYGSKYKVKVSIKNNRVIDCKCNCPDNYNICKHIIATILEQV